MWQRVENAEKKNINFCPDCGASQRDVHQKTLDWLLISLQYYLTGMFTPLINPHHLHRIYDRASNRKSFCPNKSSSSTDPNT